MLRLLLLRLEISGACRPRSARAPARVQRDSGLPEHGAQVEQEFERSAVRRGRAESETKVGTDSLSFPSAVSVPIWLLVYVVPLMR